MPPEEFETGIPASVQPQMHALDGADAGIDPVSQFLRLHSADA